MILHTARNNFETSLRTLYHIIAKIVFTIGNTNIKRTVLSRRNININKINLISSLDLQGVWTSNISMSMLIKVAFKGTASLKMVKCYYGTKLS